MSLLIEEHGNRRPTQRLIRQAWGNAATRLFTASSRVERALVIGRVLPQPLPLTMANRYS